MKSRKSKIPLRAGRGTQNPAWSVTRRQRTEVLPRRDIETGSAQYESRTVTTTERVQMIPYPVDAEGPGLPIEVLSPIGQSEDSTASTVTTQESHPVPVMSGVSADGVVLYTGINDVSEIISTTMITTTTTTYSVLEIDTEEQTSEETTSSSSSGNGKSEGSISDVPREFEIVSIDDMVESSPEKEQFYVVVGKQDSPVHAHVKPGYVIKSIDIDLPSSESKDSPSVERLSMYTEDTPSEGEFVDAYEYLDKHDYDAYEGTIASTSRACEIAQEPIGRYVSVYHSGISESLGTEQKHINKDISHVIAKYSGEYKRADVEGEHTVFLDPSTGHIVETQESERLTDEKSLKHRKKVKSKYKIKFSHPFKIEEDELDNTIDQQQQDSPKFESRTTSLADEIKSHQDYGEIHLRESIPTLTGSIVIIDDTEVPTPEDSEDTFYTVPQAADMDYSPMIPQNNVLALNQANYTKGETTETHISTYENEYPALPQNEFTDIVDESFWVREDKYTDLEAFEEPQSSAQDRQQDQIIYIKRTAEIHEEPIHEHVSLYHSGFSDEPALKFVELPKVPPRAHAEKETAVAVNITGYYKKSPDKAAHNSLNHSVIKIVEIPTEVPVEQVVIEEKPAIGAKIITGLFKKGEAYLDYPVSEVYEGPVELTPYAKDVEGEPLDKHVTVYHSGRSDELAPVEEKRPRVTDTSAETDLQQARLEEKLSAVVDIKDVPSKLEVLREDEYVATSVLGGDEVIPQAIFKDVEVPISTLPKTEDIGAIPLDEQVNFVASWKSALLHSEEFAGELLRATESKAERIVESRSYPAFELYRGPLNVTTYDGGIEAEPLIRYVTVYHSGRSDEGRSDILFAPKESLRIDVSALPKGDELKKLDGAQLEVKPSPPVTARSAQEYRIKTPLVAVSEPALYREIRDIGAIGRDRTVDFDVSISAKSPGGRPIPVGIAHPVSKITGHPLQIPSSEQFTQIRSEPEAGPQDYHRRTREVDYWIGRHTERQTRPITREIAADVGIDLASDSSWQQKSTVDTLRPESMRDYPSRREIRSKSAQVSARSVSPTAHLHWTTVSETTSVSYTKRISIERRRPKIQTTQKVELPATLPRPSRQYRPPPPPPEMTTYASADWTNLRNGRPQRPYSGIALQGVYQTERSRYEMSTAPPVYRSSTEIKTYRNPVRYDLPRPASPPRYEHWASERNNWTIEGSPRQVRVADRHKVVNGTATGGEELDHGKRTEQKHDVLHYQRSNLEEIPIVSLIRDLPMIEDGASEYPTPNVEPPPIQTQGLPPGEHSRPTRSAPLRRARQRIRNLCTML